MKNNTVYLLINQVTDRIQQFHCEEDVAIAVLKEVKPYRIIKSSPTDFRVIREIPEGLTVVELVDWFRTPRI